MSLQSHHHFNRKRWSALIAVSLGVLLLVALQILKYRSDVANLREAYVTQKSKEVDALSNGLESKFGYLYQAIRTMSLLPGVKSLDRHGKNFDENARMTVQQIYNNAFSNVALSEIYLLPKTLDPDKMDPVTKKPEEPIATFDELIVSADKSNSPEEEKAPALEEVEIFEYRAMKDQLTYLAEKYPTSKSFDGFNVPAITSRELITCDNSEFSEQDLKAGNDSPRLGIVYTAPVYSSAGAFTGGVSAVIRTKVLKEALPPGAMLVNSSLSLELAQEFNEALKSALPHFRKNQTHPDLIFSQNRVLSIKDASEWRLWFALDDDDFYSLPAVSSARKMLWGGIIAILVLAALLLFQLLSNYKLFQKIAESVVRLQSDSISLKTFASRISESISALGRSSAQQASAAYETATAVDEIRSMAEKTGQGSRHLSQIVDQSRQTTSQAEAGIQTMYTAMNEIDVSSAKLAQDVEENNREIAEIVGVISQIGEKAKVINDIVFQTKLLSFNASVEAARAGEHGKGFAVVAEEVGNLARMSGTAAVEISQMLQDGIDRVNSIVSKTRETMHHAAEEGRVRVRQGTQSVENCGKALQDIVRIMAEIKDMTSQMLNATQEQEKGIREISSSMHIFNNSAQESDQATKQVDKVSSQIVEQSDSLQALVAELSKLCQMSTDSLVRESKDSSLETVPLEFVSFEKTEIHSESPPSKKRKKSLAQ